MKDLKQIKAALEKAAGTMKYLNYQLNRISELVAEAEAEAEAVETTPEEPEALAPESSVHIERSSITAKFTEEELHYLYEQEAERYFEGL